MRQLIPLFWNSGNICPKLHSQGGIYQSPGSKGWVVNPVVGHWAFVNSQRPKAKIIVPILKQSLVQTH